MKKNRRQLRGKPLLANCHKAKLTTNEYGANDKRKFCYGLVDKTTDFYLNQCIDCNALVIFAEPIGKDD